MSIEECASRFQGLRSSDQVLRFGYSRVPNRCLRLRYSVQVPHAACLPPTNHFLHKIASFARNARILLALKDDLWYNIFSNAS